MKLELTTLALCVAGMGLSSQLATRARPDLSAPTAMSTSQQEKLEQVAKLVEERRKERMKVLTRNLEVCDLLEMRNP